LFERRLGFFFLQGDRARRAVDPGLVMYELAAVSLLLLSPPSSIDGSERRRRRRSSAAPGQPPQMQTRPPFVSLFKHTDNRSTITNLSFWSSGPERCSSVQPNASPFERTNPKTTTPPLIEGRPRPLAPPHTLARNGNRPSGKRRARARARRALWVRA
jgi:hypothetical protein